MLEWLRWGVEWSAHYVRKKSNALRYEIYMSRAVDGSGQSIDCVL